jgi:hypothetical protein
MNEEQFRNLRKELARVAGLDEPASLVDHCHVKVGGIDVILEHSPGISPEVLYLRVHLGSLTPEHRAEIAVAMLHSNFFDGWGGVHVFSLVPPLDDVVLTVSTPLGAATTAQELWQTLSDVASHGSTLWKQVNAVAEMVLH